MKVLVLDDQLAEVDMADIITETTRMAGDEVVIVGDSISAEERLRAEKFDVILLDGELRKGDITGPEAFRKWKEMQIPLPPVFIISGNMDLQDAGIRYGARGVFAKFFVISGKLASLKEALGWRI